MKRLTVYVLVLTLFMSACPAARADWGDYGGYTYTVSASTSLAGASNAQLTNINLAVSRIHGTRIPYGSAFSFNDIVGPRTSDYGFKNAKNGRNILVCGGGVGQVASAVYLAVRQLNNVEFTELRKYGANYRGTYVPTGDEAVVVDYQNREDMAFYNGEGDLTLEIWVSRSNIFCSVTVNAGGSGPSDAGTQIGYASVPLTGTNALRNNVSRAAESVNGTQLTYLGEFSFNRAVGPRTAGNGYAAAVNGRGVRVTGGGVAQVASAVYMAVKNLSCVSVTEMRTYGIGYNQSYVDDPDDAVVTDYANGIDFRFSYRGFGTLTVFTYVNASGNRLVCEVYEKTGW